MKPLQNDPQQPSRAHYDASNRVPIGPLWRGTKILKCRVSRAGKRSPDSESAPRAREIRSRFSCWYTKMRFREQLRWGHHGGGTSGLGSGQGATSVLQKQYREPPIANAVEGTCSTTYRQSGPARGHSPSGVEGVGTSVTSHLSGPLGTGGKQKLSRH
jgi:hypothetical protein